MADFPVPTGREEEWRFTPLKRLRGLHDGRRVATGDDVDVDVDAARRASRVDDVERATTPALRQRRWPRADRVSALALRRRPSRRCCVDVPAEAELAEPVVVDADRRRAPRPPSRPPGRRASARSPRRPWCSTTPVSATLADNVEVLVGDGAQLTVVTVAGLGRRRGARCSTSTRGSAGTPSSSTSWSRFGGDLVRHRHQRRRTPAPAATPSCSACTSPTPASTSSTGCFVDHAAPHCRSHVAYKGALQGEDAHTVWIGDVLIRPGGRGHRHLRDQPQPVLTDGARADSVPNLEIETGEIVGAGHASATGRFDDEQLFYLQSRGIPEDEARRLVVRGFFADLIGKIGVPELAGAADRHRSRPSWPRARSLTVSRDA